MGWYIWRVKEREEEIRKIAKCIRGVKKITPFLLTVVIFLYLNKKQGSEIFIISNDIWKYK